MIEGMVVAARNSFPTREDDAKPASGQGLAAAGRGSATTFSKNKSLSPSSCVASEIIKLSKGKIGGVVPGGAAADKKWKGWGKNASEGGDVPPAPRERKGGTGDSPEGRGGGGRGGGLPHPRGSGTGGRKGERGGGGRGVTRSTGGNRHPRNSSGVEEPAAEADAANVEDTSFSSGQDVDFISAIKADLGPPEAEILGAGGGGMGSRRRERECAMSDDKEGIMSADSSANNSAAALNPVPGSLVAAGLRTEDVGCGGSGGESWERGQRETLSPGKRDRKKGSGVAGTGGRPPAANVGRLPGRPNSKGRNQTRRCQDRSIVASSAACPAEESYTQDSHETMDSMRTFGGKSEETGVSALTAPTVNPINDSMRTMGSASASDSEALSGIIPDGDEAALRGTLSRAPPAAQIVTAHAATATVKELVMMGKSGETGVSVLTEPTVDSMRTLGGRSDNAELSGVVLQGDAAANPTADPQQIGEQLGVKGGAAATPPSGERRHQGQASAATPRHSRGALDRAPPASPRVTAHAIAAAAKELVIMGESEQTNISAVTAPTYKFEGGASLNRQMVTNQTETDAADPSILLDRELHGVKEDAKATLQCEERRHGVQAPAVTPQHLRETLSQHRAPPATQRVTANVIAAVVEEFAVLGESEQTGISTITAPTCGYNEGASLRQQMATGQTETDSTEVAILPNRAQWQRESATRQISTGNQTETTQVIANTAKELSGEQQDVASSRPKMHRPAEEQQLTPVAKNRRTWQGDGKRTNRRETSNYDGDGFIISSTPNTGPGFFGTVNRNQGKVQSQTTKGAGHEVEEDVMSVLFDRSARTDDLFAREREHRNAEWQHRNEVKSHHERRVAEKGVSYFISLEKTRSSDSSFVDVDVKQLLWNEDRVRQAAAGDGSSLSGLLLVLQWIAAKYARGKDCPIDLPPLPDEVSLALKTPGALKALADRRLNGSDGLTILHIIAAAEADCALQISQILVECFGAEFDNLKDSGGRSARNIALANNNRRMTQWARSVGTILGRYKVEKGPPIHQSATCTVVSATDVEEANDWRYVALKISAEHAHYERELEIRLVHKPGSGVNISPDSNRFQESHVVNLYRYHDEMDHNNKRVMCLVMPLAARSLDDIIRAEHVAGRDLYLIKDFALTAARALQHLHSDHGIVHGDFKPRNVVRMGSPFRLIDFDSSVRIGDDVGTEEVSTGYCPPELAKVIFSGGGGLEKLKKQRDEMKSHLAAVECPMTVRAFIEEKLMSIEENIAQLEAGGRDPPKAHPTLDIWSFGVVMYYLLTGSCLFQCNVADNLVCVEEERKLVQWKGLRKDHLRSVLANCPGATGADIHAARHMLRMCLMPDPSHRPQSMAEVLRMPFLDSSAESPWTPGEKNSIRFLFSGPLVFSEDGKLYPVKPLNFEQERDLLVHCLKNVKKDISLSFDAATVPRLQELAGTRCGCLHFSGHGHPSCLVFEDGFGGAHFLTVDGLRKVISRREAFQFVFVAACDSRAVGQAFVDAGVLHVLCCEHESRLRDDTAAQFTCSFYRELAKGSTIQVAYDAAVGVVSVGVGGESESQKYVLLPRDKDHNISIFDTDDDDDFDEENKVETLLPAPPVDFVGHQVDIYGVVSEVLSDSGQKHFIFLVGGNHTLRRNLLSAACYYIKDRLSTTLSVDKMLYVKQHSVGGEDSNASLLYSLFKQLVPAEEAVSARKDSLEESICQALKGKKVLIVSDGVENTDSLCSFLSSLCEVAAKVKVLISADKEPSCSFSARKTVLSVGRSGVSSEVSLSPALCI